MARIVEFPLEDGGSVLVRVPDDSFTFGEATRGLGDSLGALTRAHETLEDAVSRVLPAAQALLRRLRSALEAPDEIRVEFGVELTAQAGAILAAAGSSASFHVSVTWRGASDGGTPDRSVDGNG
jgi:hypothetical protein